MVEQCKSCHGECSTCEVCPVCGAKGMEVPKETVESLTKTNQHHLKSDAFCLCVNRSCDVAYYSENKYLSISDIKVSIWFKNKKEKYMICYCRDITLDDVKKAVKEISKDDIVINDVLEKLNKLNIKTDCLHNNPTGSCCSRLFKNAIKYALKDQ